MLASIILKFELWACWNQSWTLKIAIDCSAEKVTSAAEHWIPIAHQKSWSYELINHNWIQKKLNWKKSMDFGFKIYEKYHRDLMSLLIIIE